LHISCHQLLFSEKRLQRFSGNNAFSTIFYDVVEPIKTATKESNRIYLYDISMRHAEQDSTLADISCELYFVNDLNTVTNARSFS